jgi:hypothetical protein
MNFGNVTIPAGKNEVVFDLSVPANVAPGNYSIAFRSFAPVPFSKNPKEQKKPPVNVVEPSTPLVLTVLPKEVARLSVAPNITLKAGAQAEIPVTVSRLFDYADALKVQLVLPPEMKSFAAGEVTIPPGRNDTKLIVSAPPETPPGNRPNLTIRATAVVHGDVTLTHEAKVNINVVK